MNPGAAATLETSKSKSKSMELTLKLKDTNNGPMFYLPSDRYVGGSIERYGEFSAGEQEFFNFVGRGGAAIDVGANLGAHSLCMVKRYSHVYSFEPQDILYRVLAANLAVYDNTTTYHAALGKEEGIIHIPKMDYSEFNNYGGLGREQWAAVPKEIVMQPVQLRMLDKFENIRAEDKIDLLKIDVEGMEKEVLEGAQGLLEQYRPVMYVENDKPPKAEELVRYIYNLGYKAYWHVTYLYNPLNFAKNPHNEWPGIASFNLICIPDGHWLTLNGAQPCTPDNPQLPPGSQA